MNRMVLFGVGSLIVGVNVAFAVSMSFPGMCSGVVGTSDFWREGQKVVIIGVKSQIYYT